MNNLFQYLFIFIRCLLFFLRWRWRRALQWRRHHSSEIKISKHFSTDKLINTHMSLFFLLFERIYYFYLFIISYSAERYEKSTSACKRTYLYTQTINSQTGYICCDLYACGTETQSKNKIIINRNISSFYNKTCIWFVFTYFTHFSLFYKLIDFFLRLLGLVLES